MHIEKFGSFGEALFNSIGLGEKHISEWSYLDPDGIIFWHSHSITDEIMIINQGVAVVGCGGRMEIVAVGLETGPAAIRFPKNKPHAIFAFSILSYVHFKNLDDDYVGHKGLSPAGELRAEAKDKARVLEIIHRAMESQSWESLLQGEHILPKSSCCGGRIKMADGGLRSKICLICKKPTEYWIKETTCAGRRP